MTIENQKNQKTLPWRTQEIAKNTNGYSHHSKH